MRQTGVRMVHFPQHQVVGMSSELSHHLTSVLFGFHVAFQQRFLNECHFTQASMKH